MTRRVRTRGAGFIIAAGLAMAACAPPPPPTPQPPPPPPGCGWSTPTARVAVKLEARASAASRTAAFQALGAVDSSRGGGGWWSLTLNAPRSEADLRSAAAKHPVIDVLEADKRASAASQVPAPNDPEWWYLWGLENSNGVDIGARAAWTKTQGLGVIVADVDSGVDITHPDLAPNIWTNSGEIPGNGLDDDRNGYLDDVHGANTAGGGRGPMTGDGNASLQGFGHGTHTSGTIAAVADNNFAVAGVAPKATLMPVRITDDPTGWARFVDMAEGIRYAVDNGASVINLSYHVDRCSTVIRDAASYANDRNVVIAKSAMNESARIDNLESMSFPNVLVVGAINAAGNKAGFSNYGPVVHLGAPGVNIRSTSSVLWGVQDMSGTSMAAPFVAGTAALLKSLHPSWTAAQIRQRILDTVDEDVRYEGLWTSGGRLNAARAVGAIQ